MWNYEEVYTAYGILTDEAVSLYGIVPYSNEASMRYGHYNLPPFPAHAYSWPRARAILR